MDGSLDIADTRLIGIRSLPQIGLRLYECEEAGRGRRRPRRCLGAVDAGRRERGRWAAEQKSALMNSSAVNSSAVNSARILCKFSQRENTARNSSVSNPAATIGSAGFNCAMSF